MGKRNVSTWFYKLGTWVNTQRVNKKRNKLSPDQIKRLEALPKWSWGVNEDAWEQGFECLLQFIEREGHSKVVISFVTKDGYKLGVWVARQRVNKKRNKLSPDQIKRLESLPKWSWGVKEDAWEQGFECLLQFIEREGHSKVPRNFITEDGYKLGPWVNTQRVNKKRNKLSPDQIGKFESLKGWVW